MEYTQTELRVMALFSSIGAVFSWLVGGIDAPLQYFLLLMTADYLTGMVAAWKTGALSSSKAFDGIKRKVIILAVVVLANTIDQAGSLGHALRGAVLVTYAIMEGMSIIENIDRMGYREYIPQFLRNKLAQIRSEKGVKI
ncbi:holin family protein [Sporomusa silvacetica]|uniref:phage holin family protein n=1 Tax=Sporomusa silvacetica TaxID=55504 RepID=UPI001FE7EC17|nr:phage holin family protein [Sporomusa silvacetica]